MTLQRQAVPTFWFILLPITLAVILLFSFLTYYVRSNADEITTNEVNRSLLEVAKDVELTLRTMMINDPRKVLGFYRLIDGLRGNQGVLTRLNEDREYILNNLKPALDRAMNSKEMAVAGTEEISLLRKRFHKQLFEVQKLPSELDIKTTIFPAPVVRIEKLQDVIELFPDRYPLPGEIEKLVIATGVRYQGKVRMKGKPYFQVTAPILAGAVCTSCHTMAVEGQPLAAISIIADMKKPVSAITTLTRRVIIFGTIIIGIILLIVFLVSKKISVSLAGLSKQALLFGEGNYDSTIQAGGTKEIVSLAESFEGARLKIHDFIYDILQSMPGLLLIVDKDGKASPNYSKATQNLFGDIHNKDVDKIIFQPAGHNFREILSALFSTKLTIPFEDLMVVAPKEIDIFNEIIKLNYYPIYDKEKILLKILVIGENITALRKSEKARAQEQKENEKILEIVKNPVGFSEFYSETESMLQKGVLMLRNKKGSLTQDQLTEIQRILHTIKGAASVFQLHDMVSNAHQSEDKLIEIIQQKKNINSDLLHPMLTSLIYELNDAQSIYETYIGFDEQNKDMVVSANEIKAVVNQYPELNQLALSWSKKRQLDFIKRKAKGIVNASSRYLNKTIKLKVNGHEGRISRQTSEIISLTLTHILRNAVAHGIEEPMIRKELGKADVGLIRIFVNNNGDMLTIAIQDDGKGINSSQLLESAIKKGVVKDASEVKPEEILNLIFAPGFSTSETVTDISGRGVGLDAVKHQIEQHQGAINVRSKEGVGTEFSIQIHRDT
jgi:signal transduction histidine kinase